MNPDLPVVVQAATLYDARTGCSCRSLPSDRGDFRLAHSGDVKIYENLDVQPRVYLAAQAAAAPNAAAALAWLAANPGEPERIVVEGGSPLTGTLGTQDSATLIDYQPERVEVQTRSAAPTYLVLADSYYPGWAATVDGNPAAILPANVLLRAVPVPAGEHTVVFTFQPTGWSAGLILSGLGATRSRWVGWRWLRGDACSIIGATMETGEKE